MTTKGKVLVLVSSGHGLPLQDGKVYAGAGYYLSSNVQAYGSALPWPDLTSRSSSECVGSGRRAEGGRCRWSAGKVSRLDIFRI